MKNTNTLSLLLTVSMILSACPILAMQPQTGVPTVQEQKNALEAKIAEQRRQKEAEELLKKQIADKQELLKKEKEAKKATVGNEATTTTVAEKATSGAETTSAEKKDETKNKKTGKRTKKASAVPLFANFSRNCKNWTKTCWTNFQAASTPTKVVSAGILGLATLFTGYLGYKALNFVYKPIKYIAILGAVLGGANLFTDNYDKSKGVLENIKSKVTSFFTNIKNIFSSLFGGSKKTEEKSSKNGKTNLVETKGVEVGSKGKKKMPKFNALKSDKNKKPEDIAPEEFEYSKKNKELFDKKMKLIASNINLLSPEEKNSELFTQLRLPDTNLSPEEKEALEAEIAIETKELDERLEKLKPATVTIPKEKGFFSNLASKLSNCYRSVKGYAGKLFSGKRKRARASKKDLTESLNNLPNNGIEIPTNQ